MQNGFLDLVFGVAHDVVPVLGLAIFLDYASSSAYCGKR
jgi:hypothetical protein